MKKNNSKKIHKKLLLEVRDLLKKYRIGDKVIIIFDKINFTVFESDLIAIFGRSGSGKTLLMQVMTGLEEIESGSIYFKNLNYADLSFKQRSELLKKNYSIVMRQDNLLEYLTVIENIALFKNIKNYQNDKYEQIINILEAESLFPLKVSDLNWLEYQKISLIAAMISNPDIVFLDEPTGNMCEKDSEEFIDIVKKINKETGQTIIIFSHDPKIALEINKVIRM